MDTQRGSQKMCSSCSWCMVKVWTWVADSCPQRPMLNWKNNQRGKNLFPPLPSDPLVFFSFHLYAIYNSVMIAPPPFLARVLPTEADLCLLVCWFRHLSRSCPGNGSCTLPEWMTVGSLENPVKVSRTFFPEMRTVDLSKAFSETPGPLSPSRWECGIEISESLDDVKLGILKAGWGDCSDYNCMVRV